MKESEIQKQILEYLRIFGPTWKIHTTGIYDPTRKAFRTNSNKGLPDIVFLSKRYGLIFFEVKKSEKEKQTTEQLMFESACDNAAADYYVVWSLEQVQRILELM